MRIVFFGTPDFAIPSLDILVKNGYDIAGVVTMPDKPAGRGHRLLHSPVKQYALEHNLHLMQPVKLKDEAFVEELRSLKADLFIVIAFRMLPEVVWGMPTLGTFNLHASLLPLYRGAAPLNWAIINGDERTGVTTFFLKHEIDTGDIIDREEVAIGPDECVGDLHDRLMMLGAELTLKTVRNIEAGTLTTTPQSELTGDLEPTPAPKIFKETCRIDWNKPAREVHNLVRGLSPYPAAWAEMKLGDETSTVKILKTKPRPDLTDSTAGTTTINGDHLTVNCADHPIEILALQPSGKRPMEAEAFLRGLGPRPLTIF